MFLLYILRFVFFNDLIVLYNFNLYSIYLDLYSIVLLYVFNTCLFLLSHFRLYCMHCICIQYMAIYILRNTSINGCPHACRATRILVYKKSHLYSKTMTMFKSLTGVLSNNC